MKKDESPQHIATTFRLFFFCKLNWRPQKVTPTKYYLIIYIKGVLFYSNSLKS